MELDEIIRLIFQALINVPQDAPERDKAFEALGALESRLDYTSPGMVLELKIDGYTNVRLK